MRIDKKYDQKVKMLTDHIKNGGTIRNLDQIMKMFSYANRSGAKKFMSKLTADGLFGFKDKKYVPSSLLTGYPLFESVRAGLPFTPENNASTQLEINRYLIARPSSTFLVKVRGDSMKDAGIMEGDIVVVDRSLDPKNDDIIIASIGGDVTIKYYKKEKGIISLMPANKSYKTIILKTDAEIIGVVVGSVRKYM